MKKVFEYLGIITVLLGSFIYTEKTVSVVKELDDIMIQIKDASKNYYIPKIEAVIDKNTIIPGINGKEININKSYHQMKSIGFYNDNYLQFNEIKVNELLINNLDKYIISGNKNKKAISMIIFIKNDDKTNEIIKVLDDLEISVDFFVDGYAVEGNELLLYNIINNNHGLGTIGYNNKYDNSSYIWLDGIVKKISNSKNSYCIKKDDISLEICSKNKNFSIDPVYIENNYFYKTKKVLNNGAIVAYDLNDKFIEEFPLIAKYIKSKGLEIVTLNNLLKE